MFDNRKGMTPKGRQGCSCLVAAAVLVGAAVIGWGLWALVIGSVVKFLFPGLGQ